MIKKKKSIGELIEKAFADNQEELDLSRKGLTIIPESIAKLRNLKELILNDNKLTTVPESLARLTNLTKLSLDGNLLETVPETITRLTGLTQLFLERNKLTTVPESITQLTNLVALGLGFNQLKTIPETIMRMASLTGVYLSHNQLTHVPESIKQLENLRVLFLSYNSIETFPEPITRLPRLTVLVYDDNHLTRVPDSITRLTNLEMLSLADNRLTEIPESITQMTNLTELLFENNELTTVPESIELLTNLKRLHLDGNQMTTVPEPITRLANLRYLSLDRNRLTEVPELITRLTNLTELILSDNPLTTPPSHIAEKGIEAIRDYFKQGKEEGFDRLFEAKLLIVGEPGAGKTTLLRKIKNRKYRLRQDDSTKGIQTTTWQFKTKKKRDFRANVWDFGGQEIYHSTHQFFLTKRSAYVLVADNRAEDTDFYYWLNIVQLLGQGSPVLVVKNENQGRIRDFSERQLGRQFTCFRQVLSTNMKTNVGFPKVVKEIEQCLATLPHIGDPLPRNWLAVRKELETNQRNWIPVRDFYQICEKHGFKKDDEKSRLSGYLHDLGVCLHFQENLVLQEIVVLKPEWATEAVYKVLDLQKVQKNQGHFSEADLRQVWSGSDYGAVRTQLLELMIEFQLCYRVPEKKDSYIAPQLLNPDPPKGYSWAPDNDALLYYKYEFMPKGIATRIIVALHGLIMGQNKVWRSGVAIQNGDTRAQIVEDRGKREIEVRVSGSFKADLRAIIMFEFEKVHRVFKDLNVVVQVPCNCVNCSSGSTPHFFKFDVLRKGRKEGWPGVQCENSGQLIPIRDILTEFERLERKNPGDRFGAGDTYFNYFQEVIQGDKKAMKFEKVEIMGGNVSFADRIQTLAQGGQTGVDRATLEAIVTGISGLSATQKMRFDAQAQEFVNAKSESEKTSVWGKIKDFLLENGVSAVKDITVEAAKALLLPKP